MSNQPKEGPMGTKQSEGRQRLTQAEVSKRAQAVAARESVAKMQLNDMAAEVRAVAMRTPGIFDHELLLGAADALENLGIQHGQPSVAQPSYDSRPPDEGEYGQ